MSTTKTLDASTVIIAGLLIVIGALLYFQTNDGGEYFCEDFSQEPHSTLETGLVGDMISIYRNNQLIAINDEMKKSKSSYEGSESILFDLEVVSKFLYHIKQGVKENAERTYKNGEKIEDEKLGLRIYYAAYPEVAKWGNQGYRDLNDFSTSTDVDPQKYEKNLTLVMVPTRENFNGDIVDFDPFDTTTYETGIPKYERIACEVEEVNGELIYIETGNCFKPATIDKSPEAQARRLILSGSNTENGNTFSRNHGQLYPPYTSSGIAF